MGSYTLMPLHNYRFKILGIAISVISIILMLLLRNFELFNLSDTMSKENQFNLFLWINCFGLFGIVYSREKHEDERIQLIRDRTFRVSFVFLISLLMSLSFTAIIANLNNTSFEIGHIVPVTMTLVFHLLLFYFRLYSNADTSEPEQTVMQNILRNKALFVVYLAVTIITLFLILFL